MVDLFASEYGWTKDYIYNHVYPSEIEPLCLCIKKRRATDYRILLAIAHNPYVKNPEEFAGVLERESEGDRPPEFDYQGFEAMKAVLSRTGRFVIK